MRLQTDVKNHQQAGNVTVSCCGIALLTRLIHPIVCSYSVAVMAVKGCPVLEHEADVPGLKHCGEFTDTKTIAIHS